MQQPLAIMVIGGLTANMLFTRMVIPVGLSGAGTAKAEADGDACSRASQTCDSRFSVGVTLLASEEGSNRCESGAYIGDIV